MASYRFYLAGRVAVEGPGATVDQTELPGRQGRLALAYLVLNRHQPVPTSAVATALWGDAVPPSWEGSLRAIVSKLRSAIAAAAGATAPDATIDADAGCYQLRAAGAWVDVEVAAREVDRAEGSRRAGDAERAWSHAAVASAIARRPVLPGEDAPWVAEERGRMRSVLVRATDVLAEVWLERGDTTLAVAAAREVVDLEPFREAGTRLLMRAHLAAGDRGEAVRAYEACRVLLATELGVDPDPATQELFAAALGGP